MRSDCTKRLRPLHAPFLLVPRERDPPERALGHDRRGQGPRGRAARRAGPVLRRQRRPRHRRGSRLPGRRTGVAVAPHRQRRLERRRGPAQRGAGAARGARRAASRRRSRRSAAAPSPPSSRANGKSSSSSRRRPSRSSRPSRKPRRNRSRRTRSRMGKALEGVNHIVYFSPLGTRGAYSSATQVSDRMFRLKGYDCTPTHDYRERTLSLPCVDPELLAGDSTGWPRPWPRRRSTARPSRGDAPSSSSSATTSPGPTRARTAPPTRAAISPTSSCRSRSGASARRRAAAGRPGRRARERRRPRARLGVPAGRTRRAADLLDRGGPRPVGLPPLARGRRPRRSRAAAGGAAPETEIASSEPPAGGAPEAAAAEKTRADKAGRVAASQEVSLVNLDANVTDAKGVPVHGLTAADFELVVGGRPAVISNFSEIAGATGGSRPGRGAASRTRSRPSARRKIAIFVDRLDARRRPQEPALLRVARRLRRTVGRARRRGHAPVVRHEPHRARAVHGGRRRRSTAPSRSSRSRAPARPAVHGNGVRRADHRRDSRRPRPRSRRARRGCGAPPQPSRRRPRPCSCPAGGQPERDGPGAPARERGVAPDEAEGRGDPLRPRRARRPRGAQGAHRREPPSLPQPRARVLPLEAARPRVHASRRTRGSSTRGTSSFRSRRPRTATA